MCTSTCRWTNNLWGTITFIEQKHEAFELWDCGERVRRAALRKDAPVVGSYQVGDIVSYCREARAGEHGLQWSVGFRLIGFDKDRNSLGETQPRTCWVICDSVSVCVAVDRLRPCTPAELLAFHYTQTKSSSPLATDAQTTRQLLIRHDLPMKMMTKMMNETMKCRS